MEAAEEVKKERNELDKARNELEKARNELDKARNELDKARNALESFQTDENVPPYFNGSAREYFAFLTQSLKDSESALRDREVALRDRESALIGLAQIALSEEQRSSKKRKATSITSRTSGGELNQDSFRNRIVERDSNRCVLTGKGGMDCDACHIVPWVYFQKHDFVGKKIFDTLFPSSCDNRVHRVMDVRNGMLIWHALHSSFDKFDFTIVKTREKYTIKTLEEYEFEPGTQKELVKTIVDLNGKELTFNAAKPNEWPGEKFLKFHNECFEDRRLILKAAAEEYSSDYDDSDETIDVWADSVKKANQWLNESVTI